MRCDYLAWANLEHTVMPQLIAELGDHASLLLLTTAGFMVKNYGSRLCIRFGLLRIIPTTLGISLIISRPPLVVLSA